MNEGPYTTSKNSQSMRIHYIPQNTCQLHSHTSVLPRTIIYQHIWSWTKRSEHKRYPNPFKLLVVCSNLLNVIIQGVW